jgi:sulfatase modifying factor 1
MGRFTLITRGPSVHLLRRFATATAAGFLLANLAAPDALAQVTIDWVTVGDAENAADPATGYGAVDEAFRIAKYLVTIQQYTVFLNAVAAADTYELYNTNMASDLNIAGISRSGSSGSYKYSVMTNDGDSGNRPITHVSWFDAARFANWMANGQPTGIQTGTTTENGAYNVSGAISGPAPSINGTNPNTGLAPSFYMPVENEWYKAAYYSPVLNSGSGGYYTYATQSNAEPGNAIGSGANQANYRRDSLYSVTQSSIYDPNANYLSDVGAFTNSASYYGTFDQSGNLYQWNDLDGNSGPLRGLRGGCWVNNAFDLSSSPRVTDVPSREDGVIGFRLASPVAVPEPSAYAMALAGIACGGFSMLRRKRA